MAFDFEGRENRKFSAYLSTLLKAPSKQVVQRVVMRVFVHRNDPAHRSHVVATIQETMGLTDIECSHLEIGLREIICRVLYKNNLECLDGVFSGMDERLVTLIKQILETNLPHWRTASINQRVSLPKLVDVDWRVDIQTASEFVNRMAVPSVLVGLQVQDQPTHRDIVPDVKHVVFEMNKETLQTMLDGLNRIRDQLSSIQT